MGEKRAYKSRKPGGGRKKLKPEYDAGKNLKEQMDAAVALYDSEMSLQAIANALNLNPIKVRKLLITAGVYESEVAEKVQDTFEEYRETQDYKTSMAVTKKIEIDGKEVTFKASAAVPRLYRIKFGRDIYKDLRQLEKSVGENDEDNSNLDLFSLEMFEDLAWLMARHADPANVPDSPEEFLDQFNTFSIYQILPQLIELWGLNVQTEVESRKNLAKVSGK